MIDETDRDDEPAAFLGSCSGARTMADGTLRLQIDLPPVSAIGAFTAFGAPGSPVALARITNQAAVEAQRRQDDQPESLYGQQAKELKLSGFFRAPEVWQHVGSDADYLAWLKTQPSAYSKRFSEYHDDGSYFCVPAHIRRVADGSGTAIKPTYSAIPLTHDEHQLQHNEGYSILGDEEWWQKMKILYVSTWAWETLKESLGYESWAQVPPEELRDWAASNAVLRYLPNCYKDILTDGQSKDAVEA